MGLRVAESMLRTKGERSVQSRSTDRRRKEGREGGTRGHVRGIVESNAKLVESSPVRTPRGGLALRRRVEQVCLYQAADVRGSSGSRPQDPKS